MDEYMFKFFVDECRVVEEKTSYVEIFNYTVSISEDHLAVLEREWPFLRGG